jgi:hypothetical protein
MCTRRRLASTLRRSNTRTSPSLFGTSEDRLDSLGETQKMGHPAKMCCSRTRRLDSKTQIFFVFPGQDPSPVASLLHKHPGFDLCRRLKRQGQVPLPSYPPIPGDLYINVQRPLVFFLRPLRLKNQLHLGAAPMSMLKKIPHL